MSIKRVSEKTLELNITTEIINLFRSLPNCKKAIWMGMKQKQEARIGIDELILNVPKGVHLALQFKSPRGKPKDGPDYKFSINDNQNNNLLRLARNKPESVHYVFPAYNSFDKLKNFSPKFLSETFFVKAIDLNSLTPSQSGRHTIIIQTNPPLIRPSVALVFSEPKLIKLLNIEDIVISYAEKINSDVLLTSQELLNWFNYLFEIYDGNPFKIGQKLRGFCTIFIPLN